MKLKWTRHASFERNTYYKAVVPMPDDLEWPCWRVSQKLVANRSVWVVTKSSDDLLTAVDQCAQFNTAEAAKAHCETMTDEALAEWKQDEPQSSPRP